MSNAPVDPAEVPVYTGHLGSLQAKVKSLAQGGTKVTTAGSDVHTSFGGLSAFYRAPEAEQLFAVTEPVARTARTLGDEMQTVSKALGTYAQEITPLVDQLDQLRREAADFRAKDAAEDDWNEDGDLVEENLARRNKIAEVWAAFQSAERDCHAKIVALVGGTALKTNDGTDRKGMYGYDAEALKQSKSLPWGDAVEESVPAWQVWEHVYDFGKGLIVDGLWGTVRGLGTLVGVDGWDAAGEAWVNLAKLSTAITIAAVPGLGAAYLTMPGNMLPSWLRDSRKAMVDTGKAMLAWDQWGTNNSRAAGAVTFNVLTALFTRGGSAAVSGVGKAGTAAKALSFAGKVGQVIDPMTYVFKGAGAGVSKIGDVVSHLKNLRGIELPKFPHDTVALPDGARLTADGTIHLPSGQTIPEGFTRLPDGTVKAPNHLTLLPPGTVRLPTDGPPRFLAEDGTIYKPDGTVEQHAQTAPRDITSKPTDGADQPRVDSPSHQEEPVMAGVGGRGDEGAAVGSEVSGAGRAGSSGGHGGNVGDNTTTGRGGSHGPPGGNASEHMPTNSLDNNSTRTGLTGDGPRGGGDTSAAGGHGPGQSLPPQYGEHATSVGTPGHEPLVPERSGGTPEQGHPDSEYASHPEEALSPETLVGENGSVPPPGHGQKLLEQIAVDGPRATRVDGVITHIDGQPVASYLDELAQKRGAEYRDARDSGIFPRKQTGACVGSVMDLRTGTIIEGINGKADVVIKLDELHPTLRKRLETIGDPPPHKDDPLGHAEVKAANELLWMRTRQGLPDDAAALTEMRAAVDFPYLNDASTGLPGRRAPFCANCNHMLQGLPSSHGRFTGFPPSDENWIP
ncbi:YwqJ-related putative deaminase [Streptomyces paromomycinus]|uniref:YwqJ-like deaminase n=1 Tax=Streptomyces paromomycinus TaxID=92743 RepID=A0A401W3V3_STREY|nr:YwqJ-related putative deaminase [Streptomyces paromomycinus]GCD44000.1 hypothetical protein GKJPGBOP_03686 [Streptomyces paromomycinus]